MSYQITEREKDVIREAFSICYTIAQKADDNDLGGTCALKAYHALSGVIVSVGSTKPTISQEDAVSIDDAANVVVSLLSKTDTPYAVQTKAKAVYDAICELKKDVEVESE